MKTTLVIMAAGIGSRFGGGIKQLEPIGPNGEIIMEYSIYDALEAGFDDVIFIIRRDLEDDFKAVIGDRIELVAPVCYAFQELDDLPDGFTKPAERTKPWGTGQAVLTIKGMVNNPFVVINADDYYGKTAFQKIHSYLVDGNRSTVAVGRHNICMAGFILENTLSENGGVTRGVCTVDEQCHLQKVTETYDIQRSELDLNGRDEGGNLVELMGAQYASMNMWGLMPEFLEELEIGFKKFLETLSVSDIKSEYLLPKIIDKMLQEDRADVSVLETQDRWFGVTYKEDKQIVMEAIRKLIADGVYRKDRKVLE